MRILLLLGALLLLGTFAWPSMQRPQPFPKESWIAFEPVTLFPGQPERRRLGGLAYLGGWSLTSNHPRFGGISALHVEGDTVLALGDAGWAMRFPLPVRPGRGSVLIEAVAEGPGDAGQKSDRDIESMAVAGSRVWLGFEQANAVWRYPRGRWKAQARAAPRAMARWPNNSGPEAMVRLADGRFLVLAEGEGKGDSEAYLFDGDPTLPATGAERLRYRPPPGYRMTDAAQLPDGRLLFLNRRARLFEGFKAKLTVGGLPLAGSHMTGIELAAFAAPAIHENFEALSVGREGGRTILWIASDDNYNGLQRTLLLKFAIGP